MLELGKNARAAARKLALASTLQKNAALRAMARAVRSSSEKIIAANEGEVSAAKARDLKESFIDRLTLTPARIEAMAKGLRKLRSCPIPWATF